MIAACEKTNTLLSIEHTRRWDPAFIKARELIRSGELGPLRTIVVEMFSLRAMLFRNGIHLIDLMNYYAETPVKWLVAELEEGFAGGDEYAGSGGRDPNSEPYASAYIRYGAGVRAFFNSYKTTLPGWQMNITCDDGRLELSDRNTRLIRGASHHEWSTSDLYTGHYMHSHQLGAVAELVDVLAWRRLGLPTERSAQCAGNRPGDAALPQRGQHAHRLAAVLAGQQATIHQWKTCARSHRPLRRYNA